FTAEVKLKNGSKQRIYLPVETWIQNKVTTFTVPVSGEAVSITIDPDNALPDVNRANNTLRVK
ncbi:MAG: peptidase, partial [Mucilaginibacter sp.]